MAERELNIVFNDVIPITFRTVLLLQLGIFLWYGLVRICYKFRVNVLALLALSYSPHKYNQEDTGTKPTGEFATAASADLDENLLLLKGIEKTLKHTTLLNMTGLALYWTTAIFTEAKSVPIMITGGIVPAFLFFHMVFFTFGKGSTMGQNRLFTSIKRVISGKINATSMRTNDILISDSLTSYSKVFNDLCMIFWYSLSSERIRYHPLVEIFVMSFPALLRIRQCWFEFRLTLDRNHLYNMTKYSIQLGPIIINLMIKVAMVHMADADEDVTSTLSKLNFWWYIISAVSSSYSFLWDIRMDWGFGLFEPLFGSQMGEFEPLHKRSQMVFDYPIAYYLAIVIDFILRFVWIFKLFVMRDAELELGLRHRVGNFLFGYDFLSFGFVVLEILEIFRRWIWCFFKLENDLIKMRCQDSISRSIPLAGLE